jgi:DNA polymerase III subunit alpha
MFRSSRICITKNRTPERIVDYALRLGRSVSATASVHACGVIITKDTLTEYMPVQYASSSDMTVVSQYSLHPVDDLGLLKDGLFRT